MSAETAAPELPKILDAGDDALVQSFESPTEVEVGGDGGGDQEAGQEAAVDQIVGAGTGAGGGEGTGGEGVEQAGGEDAAAATESAPAQAAPAAAGELPAWSKPLQGVQQEIANTKRDIAELKGILQETLTSLKSGGKGKEEAAAAVQQAKDELAEIEQQIADPKFDSFEHSPAVLKKLIEKIRASDARMQELQGKFTAADADKKAVADRESQWEDWGDKNADVGRKRGEDLWNEALAEAQQIDPAMTKPQLQGAAKVLWNQKLAAEKAKKAPTPAGSETAPAAVAASQAAPPAKKLPASGGKLGPSDGRVSGGNPPKATTLEDEVRKGEYSLADELL